jgi:hypothetical protein
MLEDRRIEAVAIKLPCAGARLIAFYDAEGHRIKRAARIEHGWLRNFRLRGDSAFIAVLACSAAHPAHR